MSHVSHQRVHAETGFYESEATDTKPSLFRKITSLFGDIFTVLTCFRFSIAAMIMLTRG